MANIMQNLSKSNVTMIDHGANCCESALTMRQPEKRIKATGSASCFWPPGEQNRGRSWWTRHLESMVIGVWAADLESDYADFAEFWRTLTPTGQPSESHESHELEVIPARVARCDQQSWTAQGSREPALLWMAAEDRGGSLAWQVAHLFMPRINPLGMDRTRMRSLQKALQNASKWSRWI